MIYPHEREQSPANSLVTSNHRWLSTSTTNMDNARPIMCRYVFIFSRAPPNPQLPQGFPCQQRHVCDNKTQRNLQALHVQCGDGSRPLQGSKSTHQQRESRTKSFTKLHCNITHLDRAVGDACGERANLASPSPPNEDLALADGGTATKASEPPKEARQTSDVQATTFIFPRCMMLPRVSQTPDRTHVCLVSEQAPTSLDVVAGSGDLLIRQRRRNRHFRRTLAQLVLCAAPAGLSGSPRQELFAQKMTEGDPLIPGAPDEDRIQQTISHAHQ